MSGIGDEPLLLFIAFRHRLDDPPREQDQQEQHRQHTAEADSNAGEHEVAVGIQIPSAVQEDDLIPLVIGVNQVAVIPQKAPGTLFSQMVRANSMAVSLSMAAIRPVLVDRITPSSLSWTVK